MMFDSYKMFTAVTAELRIKIHIYNAQYLHMHAH